MNLFYKFAVTAVCVAGITSFEATASDNQAFASETALNSGLEVKNTKPCRIAPPGEDDQYITEQPEGKETVLSKKGTGYGSVYTGMIVIMPYTQQLDGCVSKLVVNGEKAYLYAPWSCRPTEGWMEGDVTDNVITFQLPQLIKKSESVFGNPILEYAVKLEEGTDEATGQATYVISEDQSFKLHIGEDGTVSSVEDGKMIGSASYTEGWFGGEGEWSWTGAGDIVTSWNKVDEQPEVAPNTLKFEDYYYINGNGHTANIYLFPLAFDGDKVWLKNAAQATSLYDNCWVGDYNAADGTVTFNSGQFLGVDWDTQNLIYAFGATWEDGVQPGEGGEGVPVVIYSYADKVVFTFDKENKTLSTKDAFVTARAKSEDSALHAYQSPSLKMQPADFVASEPQAPFIESYYPADEYNENPNMYFILPLLDKDMNVLDMKNMYYSVYLDDELYVYNKSDYNDLPEDEMTEIPVIGFPQGTPQYFIFVDNWVGGTIFTKKAYDRIGVQTVYRQGDHVTRSEITYDQPSSVDNVMTDGVLVDETFYDMQGRVVKNPADGLYIRRATYSDGTVITRKIVRK